MFNLRKLCYELKKCREVKPIFVTIFMTLSKNCQFRRKHLFTAYDVLNGYY